MPPMLPGETREDEKRARRVAVVVLNWNGLAYTRAAVTSVLAQTYPETRCVVADNGSEPDEVAGLRALTAETGIHLVENGANLGFSGGNNRGAEAARALGADTLLFLNNDATLASDAVARMVAALDADPSIGALSPCIYHARGEGRDVWFGSGAAHLDHPSLVTLRAERPAPGPDGLSAPTDWACGCAMMMPSDLFFSVGGFDEGLFAYHEDVDLSLKVRGAGFRCAVVPAASAWHVGGGGTAGLSPRQLYYTTRNARTVAERHGAAGERAAFARRAAFRLRLLTLALLASASEANLERAAALRLGEIDGEMGVGGSFEARRAALDAAREAARSDRKRAQALAALLPPPARRRLAARLSAALGLPPPA